MRLLSTIAVLATCSLAAEPKWEIAVSGKVSVKTRSRPGTAVREVLAETDLDAPAFHVQRAIESADRYASFMPYVKESRYVGEPEADGSRWAYTRLAPPVVMPRDFVVRTRTMSRVTEDNEGEFTMAWEADGKKLPSRANAVRLSLNEGTWRVTPMPGGRCHVVYQFAVDPGGLIPPFLADLGNRSAVPETFAAIEREALKAAR